MIIVGLLDTLTETEKIECGEYLRKRDLPPSIYDQQIYSRQHPHDKGDYIVGIKEGKEVLVEVFRK